jgi:transcriptional regulator
MYTPAAFRQTDSEAILQLVAEYPLATVVVQTASGMEASHIPLLHVPGAGHGRLIGHVAKANTIWKDHQPGTAALAIFQGPEHYVSPNWYPSKHEHGRVVPTWNYAAVHVQAALTFHHEAQWLRGAVTQLTDVMEARAAVQEKAAPWRVTDAPEEFIAGMLNAIVGIEFVITAMDGKWKVSQNRSSEDRAGVAEGLKTSKSADANEMRKLVAG